MEISKLKEEVKRLELKSRDLGMETLMAEKADIICQVMHWEAESIAAKDSLKKSEYTRGLDIANVVDEDMAKFKSSDEFTILLKKELMLDLTLGWRLSSTTYGHTIRTSTMHS